MKKIYLVLLSVGAMICAMAAGFFFNQSAPKRGAVFAVLAGILLLMLLAGYLLNRQKEAARKKNPRTLSTRSAEPPALNIALYSELNRLIDETKDINPYLRGCGAPGGIVKSVNVGGTTNWYMHKGDLLYNEFAADYPHGEIPKVTHPCIQSQRTVTSDDGATDTHILKIDLNKLLYEWGQKHPQKRKYMNVIRMVLNESLIQDTPTDENSFLNKSIEEVRAIKKAYKKDPTKKKRRKHGEEQP